MFENVGRDPDKEGGKRRLISMILTIGLFGGGTGMSAAIAYYTATEVIPEILEDVELVELVEIEEVPEEAPPPPPPPPPAAPDEEIDETSTEQPQPDEMVEEIQELDEVEDKVASDKGRPPPDPNGVVGGEYGGQAGGVVGGTGVRVMHHSEVEVKKRIDPEYPKAAKDANLGDQRCLVKVKIDEEGVPYDVVVENCPKVFHAATIDAIMKWRWYPPKVGKERVKAQITIGVNYKVR